MMILDAVGAVLDEQLHAGGLGDAEKLQHLGQERVADATEGRLEEKQVERRRRELVDHDVPADPDRAEWPVEHLRADRDQLLGRAARMVGDDPRPDEVAEIVVSQPGRPSLAEQPADHVEPRSDRGVEIHLLEEGPQSVFEDLRLGDQHPEVGDELVELAILRQHARLRAREEIRQVRDRHG
jgi:hypothetical protein